MCATMNKNSKRYIVVVGGEDLASCEYLEWQANSNWKACADLPKPLSEAQLIRDPESGDLVLLGGFSDGIEQDSIYRLSDISGDWIKQSQTLKAARSAFSAMFVSNKFLPCD